MSDLVKRLRDGCNLQQHDGECAAARIEALEASLAAMTEDRDKWAAESSENLRSLAAMTANAQALADGVSRARSYINGPGIDRTKPILRHLDEALATHAKLMEGK